MSNKIALEEEIEYLEGVIATLLLQRKEIEANRHDLVLGHAVLEREIEALRAQLVIANT